MSFPLIRGVKQLHVVALIWMTDKKIPLALFECETLEVLALDMGCIDFELPSSFSLPNLKVLRLRLACYVDGGFITRLSSSCPLLKDLTLIGVRRNLGSINVIFAPYLRKLVLRLATFEKHGNKFFPMNKYILDAPNLKYLDYCQDLKAQYSIKVSNSLVEARLDVPLTAIEGVRLLKSLSNVQRLLLRRTCIKSLGLCVLKHNSKVPTFSNLRHLHLKCGGSQISHEVVLELLHASPVLEIIFFQDLKRNVWKNEVERWNTSEVIPSCLETNLKRVVIVNPFKGTEMELAMVKYFLRSALVMEELVILHWNWMTLESKRLLETKLQTLPRRSPTCSIKMEHS